jgi:2,3-bisphosphoglycerate-independent phosphoglycerate mutase
MNLHKDNMIPGKLYHVVHILEQHSFIGVYIKHTYEPQRSGNTKDRYHFLEGKDVINISNVLVESVQLLG